jgi:imidazolonepropionase-like amidohydrolase
VKEIRAGYMDAAALGLPASTAVVDLTNAFVMPGFIDLHVHLSSGAEVGEIWRSANRTNYFTLVGLRSANATLMAGFTTVRIWARRGTRSSDCAMRFATASCPDHASSRPAIRSADQWTRRQSRDARRDHGSRHQARRVRRTGAMRHVVRLAIRRGADVIKVMATGGTLDEGDGGTGQMFTDAELQAIADTAHSFGRKVTAHAHAKAGIDACVLAGFDSIEHGMWADEATLRP